jgi:hypothetical protein
MNSPKDLYSPWEDRRKAFESQLRKIGIQTIDLERYKKDKKYQSVVDNVYIRNLRVINDEERIAYYNSERRTISTKYFTVQSYEIIPSQFEALINAIVSKDVKCQRCGIDRDDPSLGSQGYILCKRCGCFYCDDCYTFLKTTFHKYQGFWKCMKCDRLQLS